MRITSCQDQKSKTLDEFYMELSQQENAVSRKGGKTMLDLITRLRTLPDERRFFGLTSLSRLCLLATDSYQSPWFVVISALDKRNYSVEYLMPERVAPWQHAYVKGVSRSEDEAVHMTVTAIERSEGWTAT